jgi:hypothetical protein
VSDTLKINARTQCRIPNDFDICQGSGNCHSAELRMPARREREVIDSSGGCCLWNTDGLAVVEEKEATIILYRPDDLQNG